MKRIIALTAIIALCLLLCSCGIIFDILLEAGHECVYTDWEITAEPSCTQQGERERYCVECYEVETQVINKLPHTPETFEGKAATCTEAGKTSGEYCSECMEIISGIKDIAPFGHTEVVDAAVPVTDDAPGRTEGKHCDTCGEILVKQMSIFSGAFSDASKYDGDYAYESVLKLPNGDAMADFYLEIDLVASEFHSSLTDGVLDENQKEDTYTVAEINFADNGLSEDEAMTVWAAYRRDHPLYYWISRTVLCGKDQITLVVDKEYINGEVREQINAELYGAVEYYVNSLCGATETYDILLGFHDGIITSADYAFMPDGTTPSTEPSAHNVLGVLLEGEGVCESYAKAYQLLLNYIGIENIFVTGYSGENHAWNLVRLDDGEWYWFDLTWDDQSEKMMGVVHNYFCVTDSTLVRWADCSTAKTTQFMEDHTPDAPGGSGVNYHYDLPDRADAPYDSDGIMLRDEIIESEGLSYVLVGFNKLALVDINIEGDVIIPEVVNHNGQQYSVACIGEYDGESRILTYGSVIDYDSKSRVHLDVTSVSIPKSVVFIFDFAFDNCYTITEFTVSEENTYFTALDGVLFTKSLYTLIKYPLAKNQQAYTIPSATVEIAYGSFGDGGNVFCPKHLNKLSIPSTVEVIGASTSNRGFRDSRPNDPSDVTYVEGYRLKLFAIFGFGLFG